MRRARAALLALACAACGCNAIFGVEEGELAAGATSASTSGGDGGGGAGGGGCGGAPACSCADPTFAALRDDFEDGDPAPLWSTYANPDDGQASAEVTGGAAVVTLLPSLPDAHYAGFTSLLEYDFRGCSVFAEVTRANAASPQTETYFGLVTVNGTAALSAIEGQVSFYVKVGENTLYSETVPYDAAAQRFWRIREHGGQVIAGFSPDAVVWTEPLQAAAPESMSQVSVSFGAGTFGASDVDPGQARFDRVNFPP